MLIFEIIRVAFAAIRANLLRSFLTTLGIVIGVAAVITMVGLGEGAQAQVEAQIQNMGTNVLTVRPEMGRNRGIAEGSEPLSVEDAEALRRETEGLLTVSPELSQRLQISYLRWNSSNDIRGVWPAYFDVYTMETQIGRVFHEGEVQGRRRVAVLGAEIPEALQTVPELLVGETVQIRGQPFEVIGVLRPKGDIGFTRPDATVYVPLSTAQFRLFGGRRQLQSIAAKVASPSQMDQAFAEIDRIMRRQHRIRPGAEADFRLGNSTDFLETFQETSRTFTFLLAGIAGISLLVGGIGIMNIMLVSVTERTREIGVRKALGATPRAIMFQFLIESLALCVLGGAVGVAAGIGGARLLTRLGEFQTAVSPEAIAIAIGFSAAIGLFFGIWPARRAARLDPIVALRYE